MAYNQTLAATALTHTMDALDESLPVSFIQSLMSVL